MGKVLLWSDGELLGRALILDSKMYCVCVSACHFQTGAAATAAAAAAAANEFILFLLRMAVYTGHGNTGAVQSGMFDKQENLIGACELHKIFFTLELWQIYEPSVRKAIGSCLQFLSLNLILRDLWEEQLIGRRTCTL